MSQITMDHITVFGPARSGLSALRLLVKRKAKSLNIIGQGDPDQWPNIDELTPLVGRENCIDQNSKHAQEVIDNSSTIILSPGIPREHPLLLSAHQKQIPVISEIELSYQLLPTPRPQIIAITGTNGKTTTTTIIGELIKAAGRSAFVGGNIGIPMADYLVEEREEEYLILELSSFQLESITTFHPDVVIFLNLFPNHGERYKKVEDYFTAKSHITKNMKSSDHIIMPDDIEIIYQWGNEITPQKHWFTNSNYKLLASELKKEYTLSDYQLVGGHNIVNLYCAIKVLEILELTNTPKSKALINQGIGKLAGVAHRLQPVKQVRGEYLALNDAKSTNWDATLTALETLDTLENHQETKVYLILGGQGRGKGDSILPSLEKVKANVDTILLIGEMARPLQKELESNIPCQIVNDVEHAVIYMDKLPPADQKRSILLFSPAFPSFDQYSNYVERGEHFISLLTTGEKQ
jgi:UDP-N-acetylmuramoylalanine--D-glutamate ligase